MFILIFLFNADNMSKSKRVELTLARKIELIKASSGKSLRQLADVFGVGKTQVGTIIKRKAEYLTAYEENAQPAKKRFKSSMQYEDVDKLTWQWFQCARGLNIPVSGPLMQEKARKFAETLSHVDFKGSSGWLDCFKARHNIASSTICGEKGSVNADTVSDWKDKLGDICEGYDPQDIWNMDETGVVLIN